MTANLSGTPNRLRTVARRLALVLATVVIGTTVVWAQHDDHPFFVPGNLVVSRAVYDNNPNNVQVGETLPPGCENTLGGCSGPATNNGLFPYVWNNALVDGSFGITSTIFLDQYTPQGRYVDSLEVPRASRDHTRHRTDQLVTSFSSKSELALHLSTDDRYLVFVGYVSPIDQLDVSNSNTPLAIDLTNPVGESFYRGIALVDADGNFHFTETNACSGNNGRSAILNDSDGANFFYTAGNAGNGSNPQPDGIIIGAGAQFVVPMLQPEFMQHPELPTPVASFNVTQIGDPADKIGKDDNFRGIAVFNNVLYYTKGSGGNGVNTMYFLDSTETTCNDTNGVGLPPTSLALPTQPMAYDPGVLQSMGLDPNTCAS
jgi:hypothetical protein